MMNCYGNMSFVYDKLIEDDIDYDLWSEIILKFCDEFKVPRKSYLDLACGTGNMLERLSKDFENSCGIDISSEMLSLCENKLREKHIKVKLLCQDMRCLRLNQKYNLITCCLDGLNYITQKDELIKAFTNVYSVLENNGLFIFDMNSYYKLSEVLGDNLFNYDSDDIVYIWENNFENEIANMYLTFFMKEGDMYRRFDEEHKERAYKTEEIKNMLKSSGFSIEKILDNYKDNIVDDKTERVVFVAKKQNNY